MNDFDNNLKPKQVQPKLYILNASIRDVRGNIINLLLYNGVHYSLDDAQVAFVNMVQEKAPQMFKVAQEGSGFFFHQHKALDAAFLKSEFQRMQETPFERAERVRQIKSMNKNQLMQALIGKGDTDKVAEYADQLSDEEQRYCVDTIIKAKHL